MGRAITSRLSLSISRKSVVLNSLSLVTKHGFITQITSSAVALGALPVLQLRKYGLTVGEVDTPRRLLLPMAKETVTRSPIRLKANTPSRQIPTASADLELALLRLAVCFTVYHPAFWPRA